MQAAVPDLSGLISNNWNGMIAIVLIIAVLFGWRMLKGDK